VGLEFRFLCFDHILGHINQALCESEESFILAPDRDVGAAGEAGIACIHPGPGIAECLRDHVIGLGGRTVRPLPHAELQLGAGASHLHRFDWPTVR
jgi:hypothetical protein